MAKKSKESRSNSRAARRADPDLDLIVPTEHSKDGKTQVMEQLAERAVRDSGKLSLKPSSSGVSKKRKGKRDARKLEKAENIQSMLEQKIEQSKKRQKVVKSYRKDDEKEEP